MDAEIHVKARGVSIDSDDAATIDLIDSDDESAGRMFLGEATLDSNQQLRQKRCLQQKKTT
jgi:hypothetical protein